jgi:hypothetical protein
MLGVVLLLAGLAASWAQDVAAPWINEGEAQMGSTVRFASEGGDYRVITSGPTRPAIGATACTIVTSRERELRVLGGKDVNENQRLGVSRVLGFEVPSGRTSVTCANRSSKSSTLGRFQVVSADGPTSVAVLVAFVLGTLLVVGALALLVRAYLSGGPTTSMPT